MYFLMKKFGLEEQIQPISKIHGNVFKAKQGLFLIPFYHPAVLAYNSNMKKYLIEDFRVLEKLEII
jgi:uracil-DNA glycosylase family 4